MSREDLSFTDKPSRSVLERVASRTGSRRRSRIATKAVTAVATLTLVASMCPGVAALGFANDQLAAGSGDLQAQDGDGQTTAEGEKIVYPDTHRMETGTYRVVNDVEIIPLLTTFSYGHGITIEKGANVTLIIDEGKMLTVRGRNVEGNVPYGGEGESPGGAGIYLPEGATLTVKGAGTLKVMGGNAGPGGAGEGATQSWTHAYDFGGRVGRGGNGGHGGFGAGAGIGTNGANGGDGGNGGDLYDFYHPTRVNIYGNEGTPGNPGAAAEKAGTLIVEDTVTVFATGGMGAQGGNGGSWGSYVDWRCIEAGFSCGTSGGGGGGGGGGAGAAIGSGGSGGGGGGGGASANVDGEPAFFYACDLDNLWGHGGQGGQGGADSSTGATGMEGASDGDDTDASRKYARAGGAGGACPERPAATSFTCKTDSNGKGPTVILGSYEYDGQPHGATVGNAVSNGGGPIEYYKADANEKLDSAPTMPGSYIARVTRTANGQDTSFDAPFTITKREVQKPTAAQLTFECADLKTGEGTEQSAFEKLETDDYAFVAGATADDGTTSQSAASAAGSYRACFELKHPETDKWAGDSEDAAKTWVPWTISAQEVNPNDVTYWGPASNSAATTVTYTGSPQWVRPWYAPARDSGGALPAWLGSFGSGRDSDVVVYYKADDKAGLVGYHENSDGSLEPVTGAQVLAWKNGVVVNGQHVDVQSGDTVWYTADADGNGSVLAVQSEAPAGANGSFVARDLSYVTQPGVKDPGTYEAVTVIDENWGEGFEPTAQVTSTVEVVAPTKAAPAKASSPKTGDAVLPAVISGMAFATLIAAGGLSLARRRM